MNKETFVIGEEVLGFDGVWMYYANVLKIIPKGNSVTYRIHYIGWDTKHDATVGPDQMMKVTEEVRAVKYQIESQANEDFNPGLATDSSPIQLPSTFILKEEVIVYSSSYFYLAKICDIRNTDVPYKINYYGWRQEYNEWMPTEKIFKVTPTMVQIKAKLKKYSKYKPPRRVSKRKSSIPTEKLANEQVLEQNTKDPCVEEKNNKKSYLMFCDKSHNNDMSSTRNEEQNKKDLCVEEKKSKKAVELFSDNSHNNMNSNRDEDDLDQFSSKKTMRKEIVTLKRLLKERDDEIADLKSMQESHVCFKCLQMVGVSHKRKNKNAKKNIDTKEFIFVKPKDYCVQNMQA